MEEATSDHGEKKAAPDVFGISELMPALLHPHPAPIPDRRVNLLIPCIASSATFGGVATALRFFESLLPHFKFARIVVSHEKTSEFEPEKWPGWSLEDEHPEGRSIAFLGDHTTSLSVMPNDLFIATFWPTALYIREALVRQARMWPSISHRFLYLIQDYEPGFYAMSARQTLAQSTYDNPEGTIAVFNTGQLTKYFHTSKLHFPVSYIFEPAMEPELQKQHTQLRNRTKERIILVYARPTMQRNGFDLLVRGLKRWAESFPQAAQWRVLSAGDSHSDIPLGGGVTLHSLGKLSMQEYADVLSKSWIGFLFEFTAHRGYVCLEMAQFGAWVIINSFQQWDTSSLSLNIVTLKDLYPTSIASTLSEYCLKYTDGATSATDDHRPLFRVKGPEFPFVGELVEQWT